MEDYELAFEYRKVDYNGTIIYTNRFGDVWVYRKSTKQYGRCSKHLNADGYYVCNAYSERLNRGTSIPIHRAVAMAFIPNPDNLPEVNHKDFNRENYNYENLEWSTHIDNVRYSRKAGRYPSQKGELNSNYGNKKLSKIYAENKEYAKEKQGRPGKQNGRCKHCYLYDKNENLVKEFDYQREAVYYLWENGLVEKVKTPEPHIIRLKSENGLNGYKLKF